LYWLRPYTAHIVAGIQPIRVSWRSTSYLRNLSENQVDCQAGYEFEKGAYRGLSVQFQVINMTNSPTRNVQDGSGFGGAVAPQEYNLYGRSMLLGIGYKFQ
jgi:iron complex outermembrane receptor protein